MRLLHRLFPGLRPLPPFVEPLLTITDGRYRARNGEVYRVKRNDDGSISRTFGGSQPSVVPLTWTPHGHYARCANEHPLDLVERLAED